MSVWLYVSWFPIYGSACVCFFFDVAWLYPGQSPHMYGYACLCVIFDLACRYSGQSPGGPQLRWCFLSAVSYIICYSEQWSATMFVIKLSMEMWPNLTQYLSIKCSWPFSILLINVRSRYCGDSPHLRHRCHLGLFQCHPINKNAPASRYCSFSQPNPSFFGFTCSWWTYKTSLSSYEEHTYKTFALLKWQRHYSVDTWYALISCIVPLLVCSLTIFHLAISSPEPPPKMRRQSSRKKTIPLTSKVVPEIEHTTSVAAKHLPSLRSPENIDAPEEGTIAQLHKRWTIQNLLPANQVLKEKVMKFSCQRFPLSLVITKTSSPPKSKSLSNQPKMM